MLTKEASQELEYEIPHYVRNDKFRKTVEWRLESTSERHNRRGAELPLLISKKFSHDPQLFKDRFSELNKI